jgi:hypothetical protein
MRRARIILAGLALALALTLPAAATASHRCRLYGVPITQIHASDRVLCSAADTLAQVEYQRGPVHWIAVHFGARPFYVTWRRAWSGACGYCSLAYRARQDRHHWATFVIGP